MRAVERGDAPEGGDVDGLDDVVGEAVLARSPHVLGAPVARDGDQRGAVEAGGPQRGGQLVPVHPGEPDVDEHQLRARLLALAASAPGPSWATATS